LPSIISETTDEILKDTLFDWTIDKLVKYKNKLEETRYIVDLLNRQESNTIKYKYIEKESSFYGDLEEYLDEYNCEMISETWLDYWEIFDKYFKTYFEEKKKHPLLNTFHRNCNVILSLNHYISKHDLAWEWYVFCYMPEWIKYNKKRQILGVERDFEMSSANIRSIMHKMEKLPINLYTANCEDNLRSLYGEILCALAILGTGGNMIISCSIIDMSTPIISILYLVSLTFEKLHIHVSKTSNDIFLIGRTYKGITANNLKKLLSWFDMVENSILDKMSIFKRTDVPVEFVNRVIDVIKAITYHTIKIINRRVMIYKEYKDKDLIDIINDMKDIRQKYAKKWIEKFHVFRLDESHEMIRNQIML
jgi:hypothetical protein